ncbi:hypothetical protein FRC01_006378 [Tulasnella sp. 417]|nr:hypothetical protein FRC01_006378 [Tulasnella sp. 417]
MSEQDKTKWYRHRPLLRVPSLSRLLGKDLLGKVSKKDNLGKSKETLPIEKPKYADPPPHPSQKSPSKLLRLPPEIITEIIKLATETFPSPFSIHQFTLNQTSPFSSASANDQSLERMLHSGSMAVKRNVSLVSREWNALSTEFLFNSVRVIRKAQIKQLWDAFESRRSRLGELQDGPGCAAWSVRVFWVDDEIPVSGRISPELYPESPSLRDFVARCRRIIVFRGFGIRVHSPLLKTATLLPVLSGIVRSTQNPLWSLNQEEEESAEHTLKALLPPEQVELEFRMDDYHEMTTFLKPPDTSSLDAIKILKLRSNGSFEGLSDLKTRLCFPNLVELHLAKVGALQLAVTFVMPSLTKVVWDLIPKDYQADLGAFLRAHGEGLLELSLRKNPQDLRKLDRTCPHLRQLDIVFDGTRSPENYFPHTSLQVLGIHNLHDVLHNKYLRHLIELIKRFPSLRVVRDANWKSCTLRDQHLRQWENSESREWQGVWQEFIDVLREKKIEFIDWRGQPVVIQRRNGLTELEIECPGVEAILSSYKKAKRRGED